MSCREFVNTPWYSLAFPLRPALFPDKFPTHRGKKVMGNITPPIAERIARQDKAGRLVFDGEK